MRFTPVIGFTKIAYKLIHEKLFKVTQKYTLFVTTKKNNDRISKPQPQGSNESIILSTIIMEKIVNFAFTTES